MGLMSNLGGDVLEQQGNGTQVPNWASHARPPLLLLLDGHAMINRASHAFDRNPMTLKQTGEKISGVYGFTGMFFRAIEEWQPTYVAVTLDTPGKTFRHEEFGDYKKDRKHDPDIPPQVEWVKRLMDSFKVPTYELPGFEADDLLGSLSRIATKMRIATVVITGDADILQLVNPWVRVVLQRTGQGDKVYTEAEVRERYGGLEPWQQVDVKAIQGDPSDGYRGVPGIGIKGAIKLIQEFGSIESLYTNLGKVEPVTLLQKLSVAEADARLCKHLATIVTDLDLEVDLDALKYGGFCRDDILRLLQELEFQSFLSKIPAERTVELDGQLVDDKGGVQTEPTETIVVDTPEKLDLLLKTLSSSDLISFDTETTSLDPVKAGLVGLSFSSQSGLGYYIPLGHIEGPQLSIETVMAQVLPLLHDDRVKKVGHNLNYDLAVLAKYGVDADKVHIGFDTMIAAHLLNERGLGLKALAFKRLGVEMVEIKELIGIGRQQVTFDNVSIPLAAPYAAADADMTLRLASILGSELDDIGLRSFLIENELPLIPVLVQMEINGITLDSEMLRSMSKDLDIEITQLEQRAFELVGHHFSLSSPKQLGEVLFGELMLPKGRRTQHGYSTDAATLEGLQRMPPEFLSNAKPGALEVVSDILEFRSLTKLKSTYVDTLPKLVDIQTSRIHTSYNQAGSATGRISSNDPNLQNIPVRSQLGRKVRTAFRSGPELGWVLVAADYAQIELRVLAHLSEDPTLVAAFDRDEDVHATTAARMFGIELGAVDDDARRLAKVMNFGVLYGLSPFGIAQQTNLSVAEGAQFIETYFETYSGVRRYLDEVIEQARLDGYVETLKGRRRYLPELTSDNTHVRHAAERMAVNTPVQGTAAEVIKAAMVAIHRDLIRQQLRTRMLLQVHDELIFEAPREEIEGLQALLQSLMPNALQLSVPLKIEVKMGITWGDLE